MTQVDVVYRYGATPSEASTLAIARIGEVYGVRGIRFEQSEKTVRIEYDSTRLSEAVIHQMLRRAGLDLTERVVLYIPPASVEPAPVTETAPR